MNVSVDALFIHCRYSAPVDEFSVDVIKQRQQIKIDIMDKRYAEYKEDEAKRIAEYQELEERMSTLVGGKRVSDNDPEAEKENLRKVYKDINYASVEIDSAEEDPLEGLEDLGFKSVGHRLGGFKDAVGDPRGRRMQGIGNMRRAAGLKSDGEQGFKPLDMTKEIAKGLQDAAQHDYDKEMGMSREYTDMKGLRKVSMDQARDAYRELQGFIDADTEVEDSVVLGGKDH